MTSSPDVVIVGGGPAGCAAALTLQRLGYTITLLERGGESCFKVGEGLPPVCRRLLTDLGVWEAFEAGPHLPSYGNQSAWGRPDLIYTDFMRSPDGHGWHLDRSHFDAMLRQELVQRDIWVEHHTRALGISQLPDGSWRVQLQDRIIHPRWLIDASGRARWVVRQLGIDRLAVDQLIASVARYNPRGEGDTDASTLVESAADGWWYTARLPSGQRIVAYLTDADSAALQQVRDAAGFEALLAATGHLRPRLQPYQLGTSPVRTAANTSRLAAFSGNGWFAVGDAAISLDPLSSQGILTGLYSGLKAGQALHHHWQGQRTALAQYDHAISDVYEQYLKHRQIAYAAEQRWTQRPFWQRRR